MSQPVLSLLPDGARSIGPSAGLLEGPDGGVVFVFGLATFGYAAGDEAGRRLAAVQLVWAKIATSREVASAFGVSGVTLWTWRRDYTAEGVVGLLRARTGPKGPIKLTKALAGRISELDAAGETLGKIAAQTGVSTATVRVALGRVGSPARQLADPLPASGPELDGDVDGDTADDTDGDTADDGGGGSGEVVVGVAGLVVLAPPVPRTADRVAARFGDLVEAPVVMTEGARLPLVGLLLALPALEMTGLLEVAAKTFGPMRKGFYGLRAVLLTGVFMALLREPRAEGATRLRPGDLGRLLGLDRAPEVKTLCRKLAELAGHGKGAQLQAALGAHHGSRCLDAVAFLYLDGHVRVYTGTRQLPKTHISRMRIAGPATEETWVGDSEGDPVMVITAAPSQSLAAELHRLLPDLRAVVGPGRRCTVVFDRGGYSPQVFTEILTNGFDLLTYFKGAWARSAVTAFSTVELTDPDGHTHSYQLAERPIELGVGGRRAAAGQDAQVASTLTLRLIIRRSPDGHQTPILTNRTDLTAAEIAYRMSARWRQENYFKYAREHFALDALDSYADHPDDMGRLVPNPAKARAINQVSGARAELIGARADLADALATERKLLTHAIRMSAYNSESALARLLRPHYARGDDEGRALLREAFTLSGDLQIIGDTLHVRLDPASAPRRSNALAALCAELNDTQTRYHGTHLTIAYSVKGHPAIT